MILVALGSNVNGPWGNPRQTVTRAVSELDRDGLKLIAVSRLIETSPYGRSNQPRFINAVARIDAHRTPEALLARLHAIERSAGRRRGIRWGPRTLDLDLLDYNGLIRNQNLQPRALTLPHPGIVDRLFVLVPLSEIVPAWRHPILHLTAREILRARQHLLGTDGGEIQD